MNSKSLRRLAADHGNLHTAGLPPNYLFPLSNASDPSSDLTSLTVLLAGPIGTPYVNGVWRLHLDIPQNYPTAPPTARFLTRLWHPNIDEKTGAVCVETLKRDWSSTLKLRDVLVTISCLLIQPNPASALNEDAGKLANEDWDGYCNRARLMTGIYAGISPELSTAVKEAQTRGDETQDGNGNNDEDTAKGKGKVIASVTAPPKRKSQRSLVAENEENMRRRGDTAEPESDPESDWIPGPVKSPKPFTATRDNIFGIKGLEDTMDVDTPKKTYPKGAQTNDDVEVEEPDDSDPFIMVPSKRVAPQPYGLRVPIPAEDSNTATPDLLKFSSRNPFSAIQPNNQSHPLLREFSWSWEESEILHDTGTIKDGPSKAEVRKRMAGEDFEERRTWEMKKFRKAALDLAKFNRGDFGPKTGIARL